MRKYTDYQKEGKFDLSDEELKSVDWINFKIVVPTEADKLEIMEAFKHFHDEGFNQDFVCCNQLVHQYLFGDQIIVSEKIFKSIK